MRKTARLDQVLIKLGYCTEADIEKAKARQGSHGGRFGKNLVELGIITDQQLLTALAEQFRLPELVPEARHVRAELVHKLPPEIIEKQSVLPLSWNAAQKVLAVATWDAGDIPTLNAVEKAFGAKAMRVVVGPEEVIRDLVSKLAPPPGGPPPKRRVQLPELFAVEVDPDDPTATPEVAPVADGAPPRVLMITAAASRKNVLPAIFSREGYDLTVVSTLEEVRLALTGTRYQTVLIADDATDMYAAWTRDGGLPPIDAELVSFSSVSSNLLANPFPYETTVKSLRNAVQALGDARSGQLGFSPPYGLILTDVQALAERYGMSRVSRDALDLAVHLLLPGSMEPSSAGRTEPFAGFASSLELATRIDFPWKLDPLLAACHALYTGARLPKGSAGPDDPLFAAQIVSIAWYRHTYVTTPQATPDERMLALRSALRDQAGRLATRELVEGYLRLIADRGGIAQDLGDRRVLLVGSERLMLSLITALRRVGREALIAVDLADAQAVAEKRLPAAIVLDHSEFPDQIDNFTRVTKLDGDALLFVLSETSNPALVLNLLDVGVDDVFGPPHDFDLVAARINRAVRSRSHDRARAHAQSGQFSANFTVFSFLDLIQMLSQGMKTVRIDLSRGKDERAIIYMKKGRMVHATCGEILGEPAVFKVITWENDGEFTVREESHLPDDETIAVPTESVLMEGLRLLDEANRATR